MMSAAISGKASRTERPNAIECRGSMRRRRPRKSNSSRPSLVISTPRSVSFACPPKKRSTDDAIPPNQDLIGSTVSMGWT